jgi:hypothetical protein
MKEIKDRDKLLSAHILQNEVLPIPIARKRTDHFSSGDRIEAIICSTPAKLSS